MMSAAQEVRLSRSAIPLSRFPEFAPRARRVPPPFSIGRASLITRARPMNCLPLHASTACSTSESSTSAKPNPLDSFENRSLITLTVPVVTPCCWNQVVKSASVARYGRLPIYKRFTSALLPVAHFLGQQGKRRVWISDTKAEAESSPTGAALAFTT